MILITGGAGYIGSHCVKRLNQDGRETVTFDNLSEGHRDAVKGKLVVGDLGNPEDLEKLFAEHPIDAILHFAAHCYVGESVENPEKYFRNNVANTLNLLSAARKAGVKRIIFSSTAATYGVPTEMPIPESHPQAPINPYGRTKLVVEQMLDAFDHAYGMKYVCLRYFNAAGADPDGEIGEDHDPETHLLPIAMRAALGIGPGLKIFGTDYDTPDGTCIRDYIHVVDLAAAHLAVLERLEQGQQRFYNLGIGNGYSVREVIEAAERVTGKKIPVKEGQRRAGDPPALFADASRIKSEIGWAAERPELEGMIESAWKWYEANPNGYDA